MTINTMKNPIAASFLQALVYATSCLFCSVVESGQEPYTRGAVADGIHAVIFSSFFFIAIGYFVNGVVALGKKARQASRRRQ